MKTRKLISFLGAAAIAASALSGLAVTASAADGDLYSFDGSDSTGWTMANGTVSVETDDHGEYLKLQGSGSGNRTGAYDLGQTISGDYVIEFDTLMTRGNGMGRIMHSNQLAFTNSTTVDSRDGAAIFAEVNTQQGTSYKEGSGSSVANAALKIDLRPYMTNSWIINDDSTSELVAYPEEAVEITDNSWVRVQAVVSGTTTTVKAIDNAGNVLIDNVAYANSTNEINQIYVCSNRGDNGSGITMLDNIRIYEGTAGELTTDGLRGEAEPIVTPSPVPVVDPVAAPELEAPADVTAGAAINFNEDAAATWSMTTSAQEITDIDGIKINIGGRSDEGSTFAQVLDYGGNNVLKLQGGNYSNAGRGPVVSLTDNLTIDSAAGTTSVMTFEVLLTHTNPGGAGRLYILSDTEQAGDDGSGAYRHPMAVLTTDGTGSTIRRSDSESTVIGIDVTQNEWHTVTVMVSPDGEGSRYRVFIDNNSDPSVVETVVGQGETATSVTALPVLAVTSASGSGAGTNSVAYIDNILTYTGVLGERASALFPTIVEAPEEETTPEPAATAEGSEIDLLPEGAEQIAKMDAGTSAVLNHSKATAVTTTAATVTAYDADMTLRGYSVYAAYDAYVEKGSTLSVIPVNNTSVGPTISLTSSAMGKVTVSGTYGSDRVVTAEDTLAAGTWYRVFIEAPQLSNEGATYTGDLTVTVYRIDPEDQAAASEIAAQITVPARNLIDRALTDFTIQTATDTDVAYVDNFVTFKAGAGVSIEPDVWTVYTATYDADGALTNVTVTENVDPSTVVPSTDENTKTFVWNQQLTPYVAPAEETPAE